MFAFGVIQQILRDTRLPIVFIEDSLYTFFLFFRIRITSISIRHILVGRLFKFRKPDEETPEIAVNARFSC